MKRHWPLGVLIFLSACKTLTPNILKRSDGSFCSGESSLEWVTSIAYPQLTNAETKYCIQQKFIEMLNIESQTMSGLSSQTPYQQQKIIEKSKDLGKLAVTLNNRIDRTIYHKPKQLEKLITDIVAETKHELIVHTDLTMLQSPILRRGFLEGLSQLNRNVTPCTNCPNIAVRFIVTGTSHQTIDQTDSENHSVFFKQLEQMTKSWSKVKVELDFPPQTDPFHYLDTNIISDNQLAIVVQPGEHLDFTSSHQLLGFFLWGGAAKALRLDIISQIIRNQKQPQDTDVNLLSASKTGLQIKPKYTKTNSIRLLKKYPFTNKSPIMVHPRRSLEDDPDNSTQHRGLQAAIYSSKKKLFISTNSLSNPSLIRALANAIKRGVSIEMHLALPDCQNTENKSLLTNQSGLKQLYSEAGIDSHSPILKVTTLTPSTGNKDLFPVVDFMSIDDELIIIGAIHLSKDQKPSPMVRTLFIWNDDLASDWKNQIISNQTKTREHAGSLNQKACQGGK